jgi:hypothetical protein
MGCWEGVRRATCTLDQVVADAILALCVAWMKGWLGRRGADDGATSAGERLGKEEGLVEGSA